jgi:integrase
VSKPLPPNITKRDGRPGSPYQGRIYVNGRRISVYGKTVTEVRSKLDAERNRGKDGLPTTDARLTLGAFVAGWLAKPPGKPIRERTRLRYEQLLRLHVVPVIGGRKLAHLQPEDVERVLDRMRAPRPGRPDGLHPRTLVHARAALQRVLRDAVRAGKLTRNVATSQFVDVETPDPRPMTIIAPPDRQKLLDTVRDDRLGPLYVIAFATGARLGEICGLRWIDVDFEAGELHFVQSVGRVGRETVIGKPKNASSSRIFPMNGTIRAAMLDQKRRQEWGMTGDRPTGLGVGLAFTNTTGGPLTGTYVTQHLQKLLKTAGLPRIRFHDARHSFVSWAHDRGVDLQTISKLVGHSSTSVTEHVYLHVFEQKKRDAVAKLDDLYGAATGS